MRGVIFQFLSKVQNMHHNGVGRLREELLAPYIFINILNGYDLSLLRKHILQNIQFQIRQVQKISVFFFFTNLIIDMNAVIFVYIPTISQLC